MDAFIKTLMTDVQQLAPILTLLGSDQCEENIASALTKGYLYAAASPLSIFGSVGLAWAGWKTLVASSATGAQILANIGFKSCGLNLTHILFDEEDKAKRYFILCDLERLFETLHIDPSRIIKVTYKGAKWNAMMTFLTAISCLSSLLPYVYINVKGGSHTIRWAFPLIRALGGFLTTTMTQLSIQIRAMSLIKDHLNLGRPGDKRVIGQALQDVPGRISFFSWGIQGLLLCGIIALLVGYIGCFVVVQSAQDVSGFLSWVLLEGGMSIARLIIWAFNPKSDDNDSPLEFVMRLDEQPPLPTCMKSDEEITVDRMLPLVHSSEFLSSITPFVGLISYFDHPDLTLFYTWTPAKWSSISPPSIHDAVPKSPDRTLYITVFHRKEGTTRVYIQNTYSEDTFYLASSPALNPEYDQLETTLCGLLVQQNDSVAANDEIRMMLSAHYTSINNQMHDTYTRPATRDEYSFSAKWTMRANDAQENPLLHREDPLPRNDFVDPQFLQLGLVEKKRRLLISSRGRWITKHLDFVTEALNDDIYAKEFRIHEMYAMEAMLVEEVGRWESQLLDKVLKFSAGLDSKGKRQLARIWSRRCGSRLDEEMRAMNIRVNGVMKLRNDSLEWDDTHETLRNAWRSLIRQYIGTATLPPLPLIDEDVGFYWRPDRNTLPGEGVQIRMMKEREDMIQRLSRGLDSDLVYDWEDSLHQQNLAKLCHRPL